MVRRFGDQLDEVFRPVREFVLESSRSGSLALRVSNVGLQGHGLMGVWGLGWEASSAKIPSKPRSKNKAKANQLVCANRFCRSDRFTRQSRSEVYAYDIIPYCWI